MSTTYYVWRRSDGYVAATAYPPRPDYDFEVLLVTEDWPEARDLIARERGRDVQS